MSDTLPINTAGIDTGKEKPKNAEFFWQKERLKPEAERMPGYAMFSGFGPEGKHSLYLPQSKKKRTMKFEGGKPVVVYSGGADLTEEINELRRRIISTGVVDPDYRVGDSFSKILFPDLVLAEYSTALLKTQYNFTDEELLFLHSGTKWPGVMVTHAMGGERSIQTLADADVSPVESDAERLSQMVTDYTIAEASPEVANEVAEAIAVGVGVVESETSGFDLETD